MDVERNEKGTRGGWRWGVLVLLCVLAYLPMFRNGFVWEDNQFIAGNPAIQGLWPPARFFQSHTVTADGTLYPVMGQRPVMTFTLALDYVLGKENPFWYHLTNLLLHLLCVLGVVFLVQRFSRSKEAGFLAGALFALHPGHAEGVIAFLGRTDLLATLFVLSGFWGYVEHLEAKGWLRAAWYAGSLLCYLLGCLSKESGLVLLGVMIIYEGFVSGKPAGEWWRKGLRLAPYLLIALFYGWYWGRVLGGQAAGWVWWGRSPGKNSLLALEAYARYMRLLVIPLILNPAHRLLLPSGFWNAKVLWGLVLLLGTLGGMSWALRKHPEAGFLASWFVIGLIPAAYFLTTPQLVEAERWLYLPSVGGCALGGGGAWLLYRRTRGWTKDAWAGLIGIALVLFGIRTGLWNTAWRDEVSLGRAILSADPGSALGHYNLGTALGSQGKYQDSEKELREAVRLEPDYIMARTNLGVTLEHLGMVEEAEQEYREVVRLNPNSAQAHTNLGNVLIKLRRMPEAEAEFHEAIRLAPGFFGAYYNLAVALIRQKRNAEAIKLLEGFVAGGGQPRAEAETMIRALKKL